MGRGAFGSIKSPSPNKSPVKSTTPKNGKAIKFLDQQLGENHEQIDDMDDENQIIQEDDDFNPEVKRFRRKNTIKDTRTAMEKLIDKFWDD